MSYYMEDKRLTDAVEHLKKLREKHEEAKQKFIDDNRGRGKSLVDIMNCNLALKFDTFESPLTESEKLLLYYIEDQENCHNRTMTELQKHMDVINGLKDLLRL